MPRNLPTASLGGGVRQRSEQERGALEPCAQTKIARVETFVVVFPTRATIAAVVLPEDACVVYDGSKIDGCWNVTCMQDRDKMNVQCKEVAQLKIYTGF